MTDTPQNPNDDFLPSDGDGETRPASPVDEHTRPSTPVTGVPSALPEQSRGHTRPQAGHPLSGKYQRGQRSRPRRRRPPPAPRDSGLYLPVWSLAIMLVIVLGISFSVVVLVVSIGGGIAPASEPIIRIITAIPSDTPVGGQPVPAASTPASQSDQGIQMPMPTFALEGPTLEPVYFSPTPEVIAIGKTVVVVDVNPQELNVRDNPGVNTGVLFRVADGYQFIVVEGPTQVDGLTWWRLQDTLDNSRIGWAAENYLRVVPQ